MDLSRPSWPPMIWEPHNNFGCHAGLEDVIDLATPEPAMAGVAPISSGASAPAVSIDEASRPNISQTVFDNEASVNDCLSQHFFYHTDTNSKLTD